MKKMVFFFALVMLGALTTFAQDEAGCKDHPMFTRLKDFLISNCSENFAALEVVLGPEKRASHEGTLTHLHYLINSEGEPKKPSWLQVTRNYENAISKIGGKKMFSDNENATYLVSSKGKDIYVAVTLNSGDPLNVEGFFLDVLEKEPMKQDIEASEMFSALNSSGSVALYINFETGKAAIKPESQSIVDQIADMLKANEGLKISIEGHTDNAGTAASNKTLSENRAKAVMAAVIAKGIDKARLTAKGWGQEKPLADNANEDGKAKNRRVEIVKVN